MTECVILFMPHHIHRNVLACLIGREVKRNVRLQTYTHSYYYHLRYASLNNGMKFIIITSLSVFRYGRKSIGNGSSVVYLGDGMASTARL